MVIEIVDLPIKRVMIFHSYGKVYQRVPSGKLAQLWNITVFHGKTYDISTGSFSIANRQSLPEGILFEISPELIQGGASGVTYRGLWQL